MRPFENLSMTALLEYASQQLQLNMPLVVYNKPNANQLIGIFQQDDLLYFVENFNETGFVFAPFEGKKVLIPENQSVIKIADFVTNLNKKNVFFPKAESDNEAKDKYKAIVQKAIDTIQAGELSKVVLSRKEKVDLTHFDAMVLFKKLLQEYPTAFTYCFFHPKVGLWFGAFSEQLLKLENTIFQTTAIAGTHIYEESKQIIWENKEKKEQQFVTDFILDKIKKVITNITVSDPYTLKAGNIVHIKTDIQGILNSDSNLKEVLEILHPTPAVCGLPVDSAKNFIQDNEGYDREYYTGFLGEINTDFISKEKNTDLYVNLRCVKIEIASNLAITKAHIYMGGGITKDSIPDNEWIETVNKSMTIKKILDCRF